MGIGCGEIGFFATYPSASESQRREDSDVTNCIFVAVRCGELPSVAHIAFYKAHSAPWCVLS